MSEINFKQLFEIKKAAYVKKVVNESLCFFFTHYLLRAERELEINKKHMRQNKFFYNDDQVTTATSVENEFVFDTLNEMIWPRLEDILDEELLPTYSYARLYRTGDRLDIHTDRPSCEISISIQLGRSHHYVWPIWAGADRFDLAEGDGVLYKGCEAPHYRQICDGPPGYYSGQVFLHYVRAKGPYASHAGDGRWPMDDINFKCFRYNDMVTK